MFTIPFLDSFTYIPVEHTAAQPHMSNLSSIECVSEVMDGGSAVASCWRVTDATLTTTTDGTVLAQLGGAGYIVNEEAMYRSHKDSGEQRVITRPSPGHIMMMGNACILGAISSLVHGGEAVLTGKAPSGEQMKEEFCKTAVSAAKVTTPVGGWVLEAHMAAE